MNLAHSLPSLSTTDKPHHQPNIGLNPLLTPAPVLSSSLWSCPDKSQRLLSGNQQSRNTNPSRSGVRCLLDFFSRSLGIQRYKGALHGSKERVLEKKRRWWWWWGGVSVKLKNLAGSVGAWLVCVCVCLCVCVSVLRGAKGVVGERRHLSSPHTHTRTYTHIHAHTRTLLCWLIPCFLGLRVLSELECVSSQHLRSMSSGINHCVCVCLCVCVSVCARVCLFVCFVWVGRARVKQW